METTGEVSCYSGADRLSHLPDEILHHILSFFPETKEIARTSVLSPRFRRLWQHHPTIRFDSSVSLDGRDPLYALAAERYLLSVQRCLLSFRSPTLQTLDLRLLSDFPFCNQSATEWVQFAASRSVRCLRLTPSSGCPKIPAAVYSCRTLTSLELHGRIPTCPDSFTGFPFLLHLKIRGPISSETLARLLPKCPSLRSLTLSFCTSLDPLNISISSGTLSVVSITYCSLVQSVRLDVPNLVSITYYGELDTLRIENACHLLDATVLTLRMGQGWLPMIQDPRIFQDLRHVSRRLEVEDWLFEIALPPTFQNLKELHCRVRRLTAPMLRGLVSVLQHCPNLEQLYLSLEARYDILGNSIRMLDYIKGTEDYSGFAALLDEYEREHPEHEVWDSWEAMEGSEDGRHSRLKFVVVECFFGTANEMKMLEYLLSMGSALEKLAIGDFLMRGKEEIHRLLDHIPRASPQLQILQMNMPSRITWLDDVFLYFG